MIASPSLIKVYRFRSIDRLLGEDQELEKETIYFASADQLNDPMEGFRDIVWSGDKIVWTNFFQTLRFLPVCNLFSVSGSWLFYAIKCG